MLKPLYTKEQFKSLDPDFRIGVVIADGMWYSFSKWKKYAKVTDEELSQWIDNELKSGRLVQSATGAKSYRYPYSSLEYWYNKYGINMGAQIVDYIFPARVWGDDHGSEITETEGFLDAPLREIGIVSFACSSHVAREVIYSLRGIARAREVEPGHYKAYCLDSVYVKAKIEEVFAAHHSRHLGKVYSRSVSKRRELVDFPEEFAHGMMLFYKTFGKSLVRRSKATMDIFLPDPEDQEAQVVMWVIDAIEKFDESASVPFSGYLDKVLSRWPYGLPNTYLGKELSDFQRTRAKALKTLKAKTGKTEFTVVELCDEMQMAKADFMRFEEKHKIWISTKNATTLTWSENSEEKSGEDLIISFNGASSCNEPDVVLASRISLAVIETALETEMYNDAFHIVSQIDSSDINLAKIKEVSEDFIQGLAVSLGL